MSSRGRPRDTWATCCCLISLIGVTCTRIDLHGASGCRPAGDRLVMGIKIGTCEASTAASFGYNWFNQAGVFSPIYICPQPGRAHTRACRDFPDLLTEHFDDVKLKNRRREGFRRMA